MDNELFIKVRLALRTHCPFQRAPTFRFNLSHRVLAPRIKKIVDTRFLFGAKALC